MAINGLGTGVFKSGAAGEKLGKVIKILVKMVVKLGRKAKTLGNSSWKLGKMT
jgi:hypothetical protein